MLLKANGKSISVPLSPQTRVCQPQWEAVWPRAWTLHPAGMTQHIVIHTLGTYTHLGRTSYCSHSTINQGPLEHFTHTFIWTNTILQALHTALTLAGTTHTHKRSWLKQSQLPIHTHSYSLPLPFHWKQKTTSMQAVQQRGWACSGPGLTCSCCYRDPATGWFEAPLCPLHGKVIETSHSIILLVQITDVVAPF